MAVQPPAKTTSRWGSFLQQAVAGVESRLDTILADEGGAKKSQEKAPEQGAKVGSGPSPLTGRTSTDTSRTSSTLRRNDRLQERLAKAVVAKSSSSLSNSSRNPRRGLDTNGAEATAQVDDRSKTTAEDTTVPRTDRTSSSAEHLVSTVVKAPSLIQPSITQLAASSLNTQLPVESTSIDCEQQPKQPTSMTATQYEEVFGRLRSKYEAVELKQQEESHEYLERIDALEAKLQYLTNEALEVAKSGKGEVSTGSWEEKLAARDETIALLLEEGQKLSQSELKHTTTIRKLCAKSVEDEKSISQYKNAAENFETLLRKEQERVKRLDVYEKAELERVQILRDREVELRKVKAEHASRSSVIETLQHELVQARNSCDTIEVQKYKALYEAEKEVTSKLRDELANVKLEADALHDRLRVELRVSSEKVEREKQTAKRKEQELRNELSTTESRLETFRTRIEEASSGGNSDWQVKLLRQIETLQTQYSAASENWRGIEASLLSRIAGLEKEKDEMSRREVDFRRKAREANAKAHRAEETLQNSGVKVQTLEDNLSNQSQQIVTLQANLSRSERDLQAAKDELKLKSNAWQGMTVERLGEPRADGSELLSPRLVQPQPRAESPVFANRKQSRPDRASPRGYRQHNTPVIGLSTASLSLSDYPRGRRPSVQPSQASGSNALFRDRSLPNGSYPPSTEHVGEPSPAYVDQQDDFFDGIVTPATPERTINDMISVSTSAAGPSVQLVERMSAAVRRLESDKAAAREEMERLASQRDEARKQVVEIMREVEQKQAADRRIRLLEVENEEVKKRYQTTLEMLGEKSELVEELRADVADVKQMYRELIERTVR